MPTTKMSFSKCGHKGHGAYCHRCDDAERLEKLADTPTDKRKSHKEWDEGALRAEAARLRAPRAPRRRTYIEPSLPE